MQADRRSAHRYDLALDLQFSAFVSRRLMYTGEGKTTNLSSHGMLIRTGMSFPRGVTLRLQIRWPVMFESRLPLQLNVVGRVVRQDENGTALRVQQAWFSREVTVVQTPANAYAPPENVVTNGA